MKFLFGLVLLSSVLFGFKADFIHDYDKALELAKSQKKDVYLMVTSNDCKWCRKFEKVTLSDESTMKMLKEKFVLLVLSRDKDVIPSHIKAKRVPKHFFLNSDGELIYSILGYWNPEDFASFVAEVENKK
ncbi:MAG: thioredoxin family protein [Helicobacteraceae bacterium]|nr:thioredoxin family protein [Candidatus Sulfurimonas ponti]